LPLTRQPRYSSSVSLCCQLSRSRISPIEQLGIQYEGCGGWRASGASAGTLGGSTGTLGELLPQAVSSGISSIGISLSLLDLLFRITSYPLYSGCTPRFL
tara:strand:- start:340 stop:639 length:300 start_codon:yes stop_codon:yes gene_type:complete